MSRRGGRVSPLSRRALYILPIWLAVALWMWIWWLNPARVNFLPLFIPLTLAMFYEFTLLPSAFLYFVLRAKRPPKRKAPAGKRVAVISLCVPSKESLRIIERQLQSMRQISYPHDSWILDEDNSAAVKALAKKYKVKYFSRKGIARYNQAVPPFKAKTKAGNVNAWLDRVKRRDYDFFVQFDIDHLAHPDYLDKTLGYFRSRKVAWVQAPSIYKNRSSWTAHGAAEQELVLQGPLQMGFYGHSETPFIIGSHCTYRTAAIREIGGFQPTRAEDHLDTVTLASKGYKGVFLPEIIAEGDGPDSLSLYLGQQFAWAYSMFQVLTTHSPTLLRTMPWRKRLQFLFAQTWYPVWSLSYFVMFFSPILALLLNRDIVSVNYQSMAEHFLPLFMSGFLVWWAGRPLMQPQKLRLFWRGVLLHAVRWPVVLKAVISSWLKITKPYMITPKGKRKSTIPSIATYWPFFLLGIISASAVLFSSIRYGSSAPTGQIVFALANAGFMATICLIDIGIFIHKATKPLHFLWPTWYQSTVAGVLLVIFTLTTLVVTPMVSQELAYALSAKQTPIASTVTGKPLSDLSLNDLIKAISSLPTPTASPAPNLGIYNVAGQLHATTPYIAENFISWDNYHYLAEQLLVTLKNHNVPLLSIDPNGETNGAQLLQNIVSGAEDPKLKELADILAATPQPVYVRFAHEMDLANLYPWGNQDPSLFIAAYRHVVTYIREQGGTNVRWVWAPAGNANAALYYPGDDVVDVIGTTVLYDQYWYGSYQPSFAELVSQRMWLEQYSKPVWIVEFGAGNADPVFQKQLINDALSNYQSLGFSALIYLNMADANINGPNYTLSSPSEFDSTFSSKLLSMTLETRKVTKPQATKHSPPQTPFLPGKTLKLSFIKPATPQQRVTPPRPITKVKAKVVKAKSNAVAPVIKPVVSIPVLLKSTNQLYSYPLKAPSAVKSWLAN